MIILSVLLLITTFNNAAGQEIKVYSPSYNVFTNDTFTVNVSINASETIGASFNLLFNSLVIEALDVKEGEFIKRCALRTFHIFPPKINNSIGKIEFQNLCFMQTLTGEGVIAEITFKAKSHGKSGLIFKDEYIFDKKGNHMQTTKKYDSWILVDNCSIISCPAGQECNKTSGLCYTLYPKIDPSYGCVSNTNSSKIFNCGDTVTESCTLNGNMKCSRHGLVIGSNDIVINGNNFNITGDTDGYGIYLENKNNVTIKNFKIYNFFIGIHLSFSNNITLRANEISNNKVGIYSNQSNSVINDNKVCGNTNVDIDSSDWQSSYGSNNICDKSNGWNDTNTIGCTNTCKAKNIFDVVEMLEYLNGQKIRLSRETQYYNFVEDGNIDLLDIIVLISNIVIGQ